jgi:hypothetical protein
MLDFPASPTVGQSFTAAGVTWIWDGAKWLPSGLSPTVAPGINDNRIVNGDMRIDQRGVASGAGGTAAGYTIDRWQYSGIQAGKGTWTRPNVACPGFPYALMFTSSSAYAVVNNDIFLFLQNIEADMISDFAWGTPNAQPVTLSFWAYSSLIGTFSGGIRNLAIQRAYPFTYSISTANTWTKISVTIPGDTVGAWPLSGNGIGATLGFSLGAGTGTYSAPANVWGSTYALAAPGAVSVVGTNGAIFQITGVKLEIGSVATPFNRQSLAKSMADCQRYYQTLGQAMLVSGYSAAGNNLYFPMPFPVVMRAAPTVAYTGIVYGNSSALAVGAVTANMVVNQCLATAVGLAYAQATASMSAEL